jgi:hypothetical protein
MKYFFRLITLACLMAAPYSMFGQCGTGFTRSKLNWDNLDYYYNSGNGVAPYGFSGGNYVTNAMEQNQRFAIGTTYASFVTSSPGFVKGKNSRHTGNIVNYTGADAYFIPTATGQTLTISFPVEVNNVSFVLYDVDALAGISVSALDLSGTPQIITAVAQATTNLAIAGSGTAALSITGNSTNAGLTANTNTATITIAGPLASLRLNVATVGTDAQFWMSSMYACISGSFPVNYHRMATAKPFTNQPDYLLTTPDNNSVYKVDPATGKAWYLFTEPGSAYVNSLAYDQSNHILYYTMDGTATPATNKQLKKYDFNTDATSVIFADIATSLNIPLFDQGVESAAAAFYDGHLYLGIEGGKFYNSNATRHAIVYKLSINAAGIPYNPVQVFATFAYDSTTGNTLHDWGDFLVKDGAIIDFNTARQGTSSSYTYPKSSFIHYDMMTGTVTNNYDNPTSAAPYAGQAGLDWAGNLYSLRAGLQKYNMAGAIATNVPITVVRGPAWRGSSGDASEPFKPKVDFGDAPSSYDPSTGDPAVHEMDSSLMLGQNFDIEWTGRGQSALADLDNYDDGMAMIPVLDSSGTYVASVSVLNKTGSNATLCAWLDWNGNGIFENTEGISKTIGNNPGRQSINLDWSGIRSNLSTGSYTYLRIRITYASNNMTTSHAGGYFNAGEVEDYRVPVNNFPLRMQGIDLSAQVTAGQIIEIKWSLPDEDEIARYTIERSADQSQWLPLSQALKGTGNASDLYLFADLKPLKGISYYRIKAWEQNGKTHLSETRKISFVETAAIVANHYNGQLYVQYRSPYSTKAMLEVISYGGQVLIQKDINVLNGLNRFQFTASLPGGIYLLRVRSGAVVQTIHFSSQ